MNQKLIKLSDNDYIIVDDSEIKKGDWYYDTNDKESLLPIYQRSQDPKFYKGCKKITHSTQPLSEECKRCTGACEQCVDKTKPLSLSEVEEAIYGYSIEKMADNWFYNEENKNHYENYNEKPSWIKGFKAHQELVKDKLFTIEDMKKIFELGQESVSNVNIPLDFDYNIKSLLPKTEWDIEFVDDKIKLI